MANNIEIKDLLDAGVYFGHLTCKWNLNMAPYIYMERNGIHVINLYKTAAKIEEAAEALKKIVASGKKVLFVATKKQAKELEKLQNEHLPKLEKYEESLKIMGDRNSYNKTEPPGLTVAGSTPVRAVRRCHTLVSGRTNVRLGFVSVHVTSVTP